ncbi:hypothetical protein AAHC03_01789 [Spirometra sp. Aus1]
MLKGRHTGWSRRGRWDCAPRAGAPHHSCNSNEKPDQVPIGEVKCGISLPLRGPPARQLLASSELLALESFPTSAAPMPLTTVAQVPRMRLKPTPLRIAHRRLQGAVVRATVIAIHVSTLDAGEAQSDAFQYGHFS